MQLVRDVIPLVHTRHYAEYPVCDDDGLLIGLVRGYALFQEETQELVAQPGKMVGVVREERLQSTPLRSLSFRQSWLQVNLLGSFAAAGVIGYYEEAVTQGGRRRGISSSDGRAIGQHGRPGPRRCVARTHPRRVEP